MPAYRPQHVDKKTFDVLKKKYKKTREDGRGSALASEAEESDEEQEEVERSKRKKQFNIESLKAEHLWPYLYPLSEKVTTVADHGLVDLKA